jgi:tetratricopeptide (TPR) repeat protein
LSSYGQTEGQPVAMHRAAVATLERLVEEHPAAAYFRRDLAHSHWHLGNYYARKEERLDAAESAFRRACEVQAALVRRHPSVTDFQEGLAKYQGSLGSLYDDTGRPQQAEAALRQALEIHETLVREHPTVGQFGINLAVTYYLIARPIRHAENPQGTLDWYGRALGALRAVRKHEPNNAMAGQFLSVVEHERGDILIGLGRADDAIAAWKEWNGFGNSGDWNGPEHQVRNATARSWARERAAGGRPAGPGGTQYAAALFYGRCVAAALGQATLSDEQRDSLKGGYSDRALRLLGEARACGYFRGPANRDALRHERIFDVLRSNKHFQKLLSDVDDDARIKRAEAKERLPFGWIGR